MPERSDEPEDAYQASGVVYDKMDRFKVAAQEAAKQTSIVTQPFNVEAVEWSRGESVFVMRVLSRVTTEHELYLAHVHEGLGTKCLVGDAVEQLTGETFYDAIAKDTVAMGVNDLVTGGLKPVSVAMHLAVGDDAWFDNEPRWRALIDGWKDACIEAGAIWGGGETPTLKEIIVPGACELSLSVTGVLGVTIDLVNPENLAPGQAIVLVGSNGIHANGLTLARKIARFHPDGYLATLPDGRPYGESLLDPTHLYVALIRRLHDFGIPVAYAINVTGHGWRKLMRAPQPFTYLIEAVPEPQPIFPFLQDAHRFIPKEEKGTERPMTDRDMYGNLNMGAGFALIVNEEDADRVVSLAQARGMKAMVAGRVVAGDKKVVIQPKNLVFEGNTLAVR